MLLEEKSAEEEDENETQRFLPPLSIKEKNVRFKLNCVGILSQK